MYQTQVKSANFVLPGFLLYFPLSHNEIITLPFDSAFWGNLLKQTKQHIYQC